MNIEEFKKMTQHDQLSYVMWDGDGEKFLKYLDCESLTGTDWGMLLASKPQLAKCCEWSKLRFSDWKRLFAFTTKFADKCPFGDFDHIETEELLRWYPELTPYSGLNEPQIMYILNDYPITPEHDDNAPIPFKSLPRLEDTAQSLKLCVVLKHYFGYPVVEAIKKKEEILRNNKTFIGIHDRYLTELNLELLPKVFCDNKIPIRCSSEPFNEGIFRKAK